ncbi:MAG: peptidoglycan recognition protein family protein [Thermoleophilaceae bacterium]
MAKRRRRHSPAQSAKRKVWAKRQEAYERKVRRLEKQLAPGGSGKPKIVTAAMQAIRPSAIFGGLGTPHYVTGHHTAGATDQSDDHAIALNRSYDDYHRSQGWGGIGYHYCLARSGAILCLRPIVQKGAHVGNHNSNNVGVMCHGTTGDRPTDAQQRSLRWLLDNAHTAAMPAAHRSPVRLSGLPRRGHNDWSGHEWNACPATHKPMYLEGGHK